MRLECMAKHRAIDRILRLFGLTEFERRVLLNTMDIPAGSTLTYSELAEKAGSSRAARAVGNALNRNPLPLLIPCHRVVSGSGLGGYHYGVPAKRLLLGIERVFRSLTSELRAPPQSRHYRKASSAAS